MEDAVTIDVAVPNPCRHLLEIEVSIPDPSAELDLCLPVWTPGSYKVREYSRHVQNFRARDGEGTPLPVEKVDKATWRIEADEVDRAAASYEVYAHTLNVREKHVDASHVFFQPTAVFTYPEGRLDSPVTLELEAPVDDWSIYCGLETIDGDPERRRAADFDELYDMPVEMGDHDQLAIEAEGIPHRMVFWGDGNYDADRLARDLPDIVSAHADLFGDVPYDDYTFITLLAEGAYGGLEHANSTSLLYPPNDFGSVPDDGDEPPIDDDEYLNFLSLVSHELFHAWNVKRIYPEALETFAYQTENYVPDIWTIEGITSFYDRTALFRGGLVDADRYLEYFADRIASYENIPGRRVQSLREAGFDAWVKLYLSDEQTLNSTVSYYLKGALFAFVLDLRMRRDTDGEHSLDDVMRHLWREYGPPNDSGFPEGIYRELAESYAETDYEQLFDDHVHGTAPFDWDAELEPFGLALERDLDDDSPESWVGVRVTDAEEGVEIDNVRSDGPAREVDVSPGDHIVGLNGWQIDDESDWRARLDDLDPGMDARLELVRRGRTLQTAVTTDERPPDDFDIRRQRDPTDAQRGRLRDWLGTTDIETLDS